MEHGRDHDERRQRAGQLRAGDASLDDEEADLERSTRHEPGRAMGSNYAPTERATERERERHRLERERGYVAAGTEGNVRGRRVPGVDSGDLDESGHKADRTVAGRSLPNARHEKG